MEESLIVIVQFILEVLFELLSCLPWDEILDALPFPSKLDIVSRCLLSLVAGAIVGAISLHLFPRTVFRYSALRIGGVVVTPIFSGHLARSAAQRRLRRGVVTAPGEHFACSYSFTLALVLIRFAYGVRP